MSWISTGIDVYLLFKKNRIKINYDLVEPIWDGLGFWWNKLWVGGQGHSKNGQM